MSTGHRPADTPENEPDPEAFVALFRAAAGETAFFGKLLPSVFRDATLQANEHHALRVALDSLERYRNSVWQPGNGQDRGQVAVGLLLVLAASRIDAELEAVDWEGGAKKVLRHLRLIIELRKFASEIGDKQSMDLLLVLYERFDAHFPDEARLWRRALLHNKPSRNKAGLRERLMALDLHKYLKRILGHRFTNLIAQLLWETTGREIDAKQVGRWISADERRRPD